MTQRYDLGHSFSDSSFRDYNIDIVPKEGGAFVQYEDYEKALNTLKLLSQGHWEAYLHNSWRAGDDRQWGEFSSKGEAETEARYQYDKELSPDSTLHGGATFVFDFDNDTLHQEAMRTLYNLGEI